jgi:hypothetical protein
MEQMHTNVQEIDNISTNTVLKICRNENTNIEFSHEQSIVYRKQRLLWHNGYTTLVGHKVAIGRASLYSDVWAYHLLIFIQLFPHISNANVILAIVNKTGTKRMMFGGKEYHV